MTVYFWGLVSIIVVGLARAVWLHVHPSGRWGEERVATGVVGAGAYRSHVHYESHDRRAPKRVLFATMLGRTWAALTGLVFAPAGLLAALLFGVAGEHAPLGVVFVIAVLALSISGFALSVALVRATGAVARRDTSTPLATTLTWSHLHHGLVVATFFSAAVVFEPHSAGLVAMTVLPTCLVGVAVTLLLASAEQRAAQVD